MQQTGIRRFLALFLLANFVLCNTPTIVLHALFANHVDQKIDFSRHSSVPQLDVAGIDCHCNSNVVNTPFLPQLATRISFPVFEYIHFHETFISRFYTPVAISYSLRGPPVLS